MGGYFVFVIGRPLSRWGVNLNLVFDPVHFLSRKASQKGDPEHRREVGKTHHKS